MIKNVSFQSNRAPFPASFRGDGAGKPIPPDGPFAPLLWGSKCCLANTKGEGPAVGMEVTRKSLNLVSDRGCSELSKWASLRAQVI